MRRVTVDMSLADCWLVLHALTCLSEKHPEDEAEAQSFRERLADAIEAQGLTAGATEFVPR